MTSIEFFGAITRVPMFVDDNGGKTTCINFNDETGCMELGTLCNAGFIPSGIELEYDDDFSVDENLQALWDVFMDTWPDA